MPDAGKYPTDLQRHLLLAYKSTGLGDESLGPRWLRRTLRAGTSARPKSDPERRELALMVDAHVRRLVELRQALQSGGRS